MIQHEQERAGALKRWLPPGLVLLAVIAVYAPVLGYPFTNWDDPYFYSENARLLASLDMPLGAGLAHMMDLGPVLRGEIIDWIPMRALVSYLVGAFVGLSGPAIHSVCLLAHLLSTLLVFRIGRRLVGGSWAPAFGAALFGLHPAGVEVVAWAPELKTALGVCFTLGALALYVDGRDREGRTCWARIGAAALLSLLAMSSSQFGVLIPGYLILLDVALPRGPLKSAAARWAPFLVLAVAGAWLHLQIRSATGIFAAWPGGSFGGTLAMTIKGFPRYLLNLVAPVALCPRHHIAPVDGALDPALWTGAATIGVLASFGVLAILRRGLALFLVGAAVLYLAPTLNLVPSTIVIADRYLYLPAAMLGLGLAAMGRARWPQAAASTRRVLTVAALGALLVLGVLGATYRATWRSSEALWTATLECAPGFFGAHHQLGRTYFDRGEVERSLPLLRRAVKLEPTQALLRISLGNALHALGRAADAEAEFRRAVELARDDEGRAQAYNGLGLCALSRGERSSARGHFLRALGLAPGNAVYEKNLERAAAEVRGREITAPPAPAP